MPASRPTLPASGGIAGYKSLRFRRGGFRRPKINAERHNLPTHDPDSSLAPSVLRTGPLSPHREVNISGISSVGSSGSLPFLISPTSVLDPADDATAAATDAPVSSPVGPGRRSTVAARRPWRTCGAEIETAVTASVSQLPADSSSQDIFNAVRSAVEDTLEATASIRGKSAAIAVAITMTIRADSEPMPRPTPAATPPQQPRPIHSSPRSNHERPGKQTAAGRRRAGDLRLRPRHTWTQ